MCSNKFSFLFNLWYTVYLIFTSCHPYNKPIKGSWEICLFVFFCCHFIRNSDVSFLSSDEWFVSLVQGFFFWSSNRTLKTLLNWQGLFVISVDLTNLMLLWHGTTLSYGRTVSLKNRCDHRHFDCLSLLIILTHDTSSSSRSSFLKSFPMFCRVFSYYVIEKVLFLLYSRLFGRPSRLCPRCRYGCFIVTSLSGYLRLKKVSLIFSLIFCTSLSKSHPIRNIKGPKKIPSLYEPY